VDASFEARRIIDVGVEIALHIKQRPQLSGASEPPCREVWLSHDGERVWKDLIEPFGSALEIDDVEPPLELGTGLFGEDATGALRLRCQDYHWPD
jgi:hypothetical protein